MKGLTYIDRIITAANSGLAKVAVQCSADTFVVNQSLVLHINICGKIPAFGNTQTVSGNRRTNTKSNYIAEQRMHKKVNEVQQQLKEFLLDKISEPLPMTVKIVEGSIPIVFFGNVEKAEIATLNLNPSNIEFEHNGVRRCVDRK